ncbi:MAG: hypothetical protein C4541_12535 [Candidatus Auribacter fodinae]|uniref:DUF3108 domain-containing protein n=1 Tax=Candidatus Auribacter fodinae TaxID=2093366 RepID=A0A3A4QUD8_9BACT|nr:MAG: hypothetical protein C4541_12535 [Candidatus Auribacter fodinae]
MKNSFIFYIAFVLIICWRTIVISDEIELNDGTVYTGRVIKETGSSLLFQTEIGVFEIQRDAIKNMRFAEQWGIEDHVVLHDDGNVQNNGAQSDKLLEFNTHYFPLKNSMKWVYNVRYRPHDSSGTIMTEHKRFFQETWSLSEAEGIRDSFYFAQFEQNVGRIFRMEITSSDADSLNTSKILFIGFESNRSDNLYLVMTDEDVSRELIFYQRLMPVNPFLKAQKEWKDIGQENNSFFYSASTIEGVEGINTDAGYFEDCLVVHHTYTIENQQIFSEVYIWYAPGVGMVKMVQDIHYPDNNNSDGITNILQEYDLAEYGVQ